MPEDNVEQMLKTVNPNNIEKINLEEAVDIKKGEEIVGYGSATGKPHLKGRKYGEKTINRKQRVPDEDEEERHIENVLAQRHARGEFKMEKSGTKGYGTKGLQSIRQYPEGNIKDKKSLKQAENKSKLKMKHIMSNVNESNKETLKKSVDSLIDTIQKSNGEITPEIEKSFSELKKGFKSLATTGAGAGIGSAIGGVPGAIVGGVAGKALGDKIDKPKVKISKASKEEIAADVDNKFKAGGEAIGGAIGSKYAGPAGEKIGGVVGKYSSNLPTSIPGAAKKVVTKIAQTKAQKMEKGVGSTIAAGGKAALRAGMKTAGVDGKSNSQIASSAAKAGTTAIANKLITPENMSRAGNAAKAVGSKAKDFAKKHPNLTTAALGAGGIAALLAARKYMKKSEDGEEETKWVKTNMDNSPIEKKQALIKIQKCIHIIKGFTPMNDEDLRKSMGGIIPIEMEVQETRPPKEWWELAIVKSATFTDEPVAYSIRVWYGDNAIQKGRNLEYIDVDDARRIQEDEPDYIHAHRGLLSDKTNAKYPKESDIENLGKILDKRPRENIQNSADAKVEKGLGGALLGGLAGSALGNVAGGAVGHKVAGTLAGGAAGTLVGNKMTEKKMEKEAVGKMICAKKMNKSLDSMTESELGELILNSIDELFQNAVAEEAEKIKPNEKLEGSAVSDGTRADIASLTDKSEKKIKTF